MFRAAMLAVGLSLSLLAPLAGQWITPTFAQDATPAAECPATAEEENQRIIESWYDAVNAHDVDAMVELMAPVVNLHAATVPDSRGVEEVKTSLAPFFVAFPDLRDEIDQLIPIDEYVVTRVIESGTQVGDFLGIPATGREATWTLISIWRIECGRIAEYWIEVDQIGRLRQLGVFPNLGAAASTPVTDATAAGVAASPAAECPSTTEEENEALVRRWYDEVYTQKNFDNFDEFLAPDHVRRGLSRDSVGAEARRAAVQVQQTALPDVEVAPDFLLSSADRVVTRWTARGTHDGPWEDIPATGNPVVWTGITIFRIECGRIAEEWAEVAGLAFFEGIGAIEWPPTPDATPEAE